MRVVELYSIFVRKLHSYMKQSNDLLRQISGYGLFEELQNRLNRVIIGGVARSTIYKAFATNGGTAKTDKILEIAKDVVAQHIERIKEIPANEPA